MIKNSLIILIWIKIIKIIQKVHKENKDNKNNKPQLTKSKMVKIFNKTKMGK